MDLKLDDARKAELVSRLQAACRDVFDEPLSKFRAETLLGLVLEAIGPAVYNQAIQDARAHMATKLDDMDGEVWWSER